MILIYKVSLNNVDNYQIYFVTYGYVFIYFHVLLYLYIYIPSTVLKCIITYINFFFRVVIQNERYEDWAIATLTLLRRLCFTYKKDVLKYHHKVLQDSGISTNLIPEAYLSTASEGNFLEVLNMALNGE